MYTQQWQAGMQGAQADVPFFACGHIPQFQAGSPLNFPISPVSLINVI